MPRGDDIKQTPLPDPPTAPAGDNDPQLTVPHAVAVELRRLVSSGEFARLLDPELPLPGVDDPAAESAANAIEDLGPEVLRSALARGLVVDLDDTLTTNIALFDRARWHMTAVYAEATDRNDLLQIIVEREEVCMELLPRLGYTPERWRTATATYLDRIAPGASEQTRQRLMAASEIALGVGEFYAGVERTLAALKRAGVPMLLLTKGEEHKQREKIVAHGLDRFFDRIQIVARKDAEVLRRAAEAAGMPDPVVIGDSAASDVAPALEAGLHAVHVDHGRGVTWAAEHHEAGALHEAKAPNFPAAILGLVSALPCEPRSG